MFPYEKIHRYLKNDYQFFDTLKKEDRKINGNCYLLIKVKFHELEWSSPLIHENISPVYLIIWHHFVKQTIFQEKKLWVWKVHFKNLCRNMSDQIYIASDISTDGQIIFILRPAWYFFSFRRGYENIAHLLRKLLPTSIIMRLCQLCLRK